MKTFTSASAGKYIKALADEKDLLLSQESTNCTYVLAKGEEEEPPAYDYAATRASVAEIDRKVRVVRHALHAFNARTVLPEAGITIDEALVELAQLGNLKSRLCGLRAVQPKQRVESRYGVKGDLVEYRYANFDVAAAQADYQKVTERIADLQLELDLVNQTQTFEVDV